jgi:hypothetical protein
VKRCISFVLVLALGACAGSDGKTNVPGTALVVATGAGILGLVGAAIHRDQQGQEEKRRQQQQPHRASPYYGQQMRMDDQRLTPLPPMSYDFNDPPAYPQSGWGR